MAKVESVNSSPSFYANKLPISELKFGLGITKDFDISSLLNDNETGFEKQYIDNDNWNGRKKDNKKGKHSPVTPVKTESLKLPSLGALAENHLKKNKMFPELSFDEDFTLSDLLSNDDYSVVKESKNAALCESDNLFDCLLTEDDNLGVGRISGAKNDISFDDLTEWMNSSVTQTSDSLAFLQNPQSSCDGKLDNISSVSLTKNTPGIHSLQSNQEKSESTNKISNIDLLNILGDISINSSEAIDSFNTTDSSETNSENHEGTNEISDNDLPDIDLTFCIKKNSKNDFSLYGNSPETVDSGFDEPDFVPDKLTNSSEGKLFYKNNFIFQSGTCSKSVKVKQSLFSKAISAKPKIDDLRKSKLKKVMNELLKGSTSLLHCNQQKNLQESPKIIDHSNEHVIISSYLNFSDEK